MKPRLKKISGIWHCGMFGVNTGRIGCGFTVRQAYADWARYV